jgi:hypothetical protein
MTMTTSTTVGLTKIVAQGTTNELNDSRGLFSLGITEVHNKKDNLSIAAGVASQTRCSKMHSKFVAQCVNAQDQHNT